jgi:glucan 1,3-beta-glucosidase
MCVNSAPTRDVRVDVRVHVPSDPNIDHTYINMTLRVLTTIVDKYKSHPAVWGLEPVNEPWQFIPIETMKEFYWNAYWIVRRGAPKWKYVMHDSFRGYPAAWWGFMKGCPNKAMDAHIYLAWNNPCAPVAKLERAACHPCAAHSPRV